MQENQQNQFKEGDLTLKFIGEDILKVYVGDKIGPDNLLRLAAIDKSIKQLKQPGIIDTVIAYLDLTIFFDPLQIRPAKLIEIIGRLKFCEEILSPRLINIPVQYGGNWGPDLAYVAELNQLTPEEVINIHTAGSYLVYAIGFTPGFPYLGGLSEKLFTPRKQNPSLKVPPGSVGIGGKQTGIYPIASPGGWQIIGRTPIDIFDINKKEPCLLQIGDTVKFVAS